MRVLSRVSVIVAAAGLLVGGCATKPVKRDIAQTFTAPGPAGFTPARLKVDKGDKVELRVTNKHDRPHGFSIDAFNVKKTVEPGKPIEVKFTAKRAGTFQIYCQLHPTHQKASLVVS